MGCYWMTSPFVIIGIIVGAIGAAELEVIPVDETEECELPFCGEVKIIPALEAAETITFLGIDRAGLT